MPKGRVLAVDDQRYFRELLEGMLIESGFEVQTAGSGEEALRVLEHAAFDVVLTDLVMPEMDGNELVIRVKQRNPDQDIVVVTGVVDVKTAVDAMKSGASEYLLKPFEPETLANTLEGVLHRRRLRVEHARLLAENIEYLGERTLIERATALFSVLAVEPLAERIVDGLCVETGAQGGVLWIAGEAEDAPLELASARGLVRLDQEPVEIALEALPDFAKGTAISSVEPWGTASASDQGSLSLVLREGARVIGLVRLTDKVAGEPFDPVDLSCAEKFVGFAQTALRNAVRMAALERSRLAEGGSGTYLYDYFQDAVRNEIEKSTRHGRCFSILRVEIQKLGALRRRSGSEDFSAWLGQVVQHLMALKRSSDLLASDGDGRFLALLPEADALGAALLKQRAAEALAGSELLTDLPENVRPVVRVAVVTYPSDGTQLESLVRLLDERIEDDARSPVRELALERHSLSECLDLLLESGWTERSETAEQIAQFVFTEPAREPQGRRLLYAAPGRILAGAVRAGLDSLRSSESQTEIAVLSSDPEPELPEIGMQWVAPGDGESLRPFVIHFGDGPAYALVCEDLPGSERARFFHTADRSLVEHLAFRVQEDLAG